MTAFDIAELNGHEDVCEVLEQYTSHQSGTKTTVTEVRPEGHNVWCVQMRVICDVDEVN